jgi:hypothetical protein
MLEAASSMFMPKKKILRSDGASLIDIYESKKQDAWGRIIKAQYLADEEAKREKQRQLDQANQDYGRKLREQLDAEEHRKMLGLEQDSVFAAMEDQTVSILASRGCVLSAAHSFSLLLPT